MRHADAELQLWLANDRIAREQREAELARQVRTAMPSASLRRRAGGAMIALGVRLAGDRPPVRNARRLAHP
jgi:hypothetical protein